MVFGVICEQGPICFTIVPLKTKINQDTYQAMIKEHVVPRIKAYEAQPGGKKVIFQQDGASSHTAKTTLDFFGKEKLLLLQNWPPKSPDLSPIENIWSLMKRDLQHDRPLTLQELVGRVGECFSKASSASTCKNLYRSLPNRLQLCIDNDGARLPYWAFQRNFLYTIYCLSDVLFFVSLEILFCCWRFLCQMFICCSIFTVVFANWKSAGTRRFLCKGHSICFFFSFFSVEDAVFLLSLSTVKK